jgi:hypothetical protein
MKFENRLLTSLLPTLMFTLLLMSSCKTTQISSLEYFKPQLSTNYQNHQVVYTFSPDSLFQSTQNLDKFDAVFFDNLQFWLTNKHYNQENSGKLQTLYLEKCIISIDDKPQETTAMLVCKSNLNKDSIFYAQVKQDRLNLSDPNNIQKLASSLAEETAHRIDSAHIQSLRKVDPVKYNATYEKSEVNGLGQAVILLVITFVLLFI